METKIITDITGFVYSLLHPLFEMIRTTVANDLFLLGLAIIGAYFFNKKSKEGVISSTYIMIILSILFFIACIGVAQAALTLNTTAEQTATFNLGASSDSLGNLTNCTWSGYAANTQNTSSGNFAFTTYVAASNGANQTTVTLNSANNGFQDESWTFSVTCNNASGATSETASGTILLNQGSPSCIVDLTNVYSSGDTISPKASYTVTGGNASSATIYFGSGNPKTMTQSTLTNRQRVFTYVDNIPETTYKQLYVILHDGNDQTTCSILNDIHISDSETAKKGIVVADLMGSGKLTGTDGFGGLGLIALAAIAIYAASSQSKKKKKR